MIKLGYNIDHTLNKNSYEFGDTVTVRLTNNESGNNVAVWLSYEIAGEETVFKKTYYTGNYSFTLSNSLMNKITNSTETVLKVYRQAYDGTLNSSRPIGSKIVVTASVKVPDNIKPQISSLSVSEGTSGISSKFGAGYYVQRKSTLNLTVNATTANDYGATISSYQIRVDGVTYTQNGITTSAIVNSGSLPIYVKVTDSRGRTAEYTWSSLVTVNAYYSPRITKFNASRCNINGTLNGEGTHFKIEYAYSICALNNNNDNSFVIEYRENGGSWQSLTSGSGYSANTNYIATGTFSVDHAYEFRIRVSDFFDTTVSDARGASGQTILDIKADGTGINFGGVSDEPGAVFDFIAKFKEPLRLLKGIEVTELTSSDNCNSIAEGIYFVGSTSLPSNSATNYSHFLICIKKVVSGNTYISQIAIAAGDSFQSGYSKVAMRGAKNSTFSEWISII